MRAGGAAATAAKGGERAAAFADFNAGAFVATDNCNEHTVTWNYTYTEGEIIRDDDFERRDAYEGVMRFVSSDGGSNVSSVCEVYTAVVGAIRS